MHIVSQPSSFTSDFFFDKSYCYYFIEKAQFVLYIRGHNTHCAPYYTFIVFRVWNRRDALPGDGDLLDITNVS